MAEVKFYDNVEDKLLKFAVIIARTNGKWVFCKHKERDTYEIPGGHREEGEDILATARRELREETGAVDFAMKPICVYSVTGQTWTYPSIQPRLLEEAQKRGYMEEGFDSRESVLA